MELKELEYIVAVAEEGSVSKAAEKLYLAQSSLSQFLSRYEKDLGAKIFVRTSSGMRATAAGEDFVQQAKEILLQYNRMKSALKESQGGHRGHIEFGISTFRGATLIPHILNRFQREYPNVELIIHEHDSVVLQRKITAGELDVAMVALRAGQKRPQDIPVMQDEVYLVANRNHPIMEYVRTEHGGPNRPWVAFSDAARFELLLSNRFTVLGSVAQHLLDTDGLIPICQNDNLTASMAAALAREGMGLALTYSSCAIPKKDVVYLSIGKDRCLVDLVLIYPPNGYRGKANRALEEMIRQYIDYRKENN